MSPSLLEMPEIESEIVVTEARAIFAPEPIESDVSNPGFTDDEIAALHQDDAMASGMIAVILTIAFSVLLALTVGVTIWTMRVAS